MENEGRKDRKWKKEREVKEEERREGEYIRTVKDNINNQKRVQG